MNITPVCFIYLRGQSLLIIPSADLLNTFIYSHVHIRVKVNEREGERERLHPLQD